jgi:hypothetical protein
MTDEKQTEGSELEITPSEVSDERREFLKKCGKFAAYTGPAIAVLLLFDKKAHAIPNSQNY